LFSTTWCFNFNIIYNYENIVEKKRKKQILTASMIHGGVKWEKGEREREVEKRECIKASEWVFVQWEHEKIKNFQILSFWFGKKSPIKFWLS